MKEGCTEVSLLRVGWSVDFSRPQLGKKKFFFYFHRHLLSYCFASWAAWLLLTNLIILGEDEFSYGFDGRGLKAENGQFEEFGQTFGENDVIGCFAVSACESCEPIVKSRDEYWEFYLLSISCCP